MKPLICLCLAVLAGCGGQSATDSSEGLVLNPGETMEIEMTGPSAEIDFTKLVQEGAARERDIAIKRYDALLKSLTEAEAAGALDSFDVDRWRGPFPSSVTDGTAFFWKKSGSGQHYISTRPATPEEVEIYSQESPHHEQ